MRRFTQIIKRVILNNKFTIFIRTTLLIAMIVSTYNWEWLTLFLTLISYGLTYLYVIFARYNIILPKEFQIIIIFFIYWALFLWEANLFYEKYFWWDILHHLFSWLALGFIGFLILYIFYKSWKFKAPILIIPVFSFCFALAIWSLWEIFEFFLDASFWVNWQKARKLCETLLQCDSRLWVMDTMYDLIIDSIWALFASIVWYIFLKKWESFFWFDSLIKKFETLNKDLFK
jgi:hypothetical protein